MLQCLHLVQGRVVHSPHYAALILSSPQSHRKEIVNVDNANYRDERMAPAAPSLYDNDNNRYLSHSKLVDNCLAATGASDICEGNNGSELFRRHNDDEEEETSSGSGSADTSGDSRDSPLSGASLRSPSPARTRRHPRSNLRRAPSQASSRNIDSDNPSVSV